MRAPAQRFPLAPARFQAGVSIVETMVGILIGLVVVVVIYNTLIVAEGFRRSTLGAADAQITGQLSQFIVGRELANAGNGVMSGPSIDALALCDNPRLRAMPVLIEDSVDAQAIPNDRLTVFYSNSPRVVHPVMVEDPEAAAPTDPITVVSPNGFKPNDWIIATDRGANCTLGQINAGGVTQPGPGYAAWPPAGTGGFVALAFTRKAGASVIYHKTAARVVNLGPGMTRTTYSIDPAKTQLNTLDDNPAVVGAVPAPLAQNVVLLKAQYGVDLNNDRVVDCWTPADAADVCGAGLDFSHTVFDSTPAPANLGLRIRQIVAIRVAIVVRSADEAKNDPANQSLWGRSAVSAPAVWIFNCAANDATCQSRVRINPILADGIRFRIYESTIPLRNSLWSDPP